jgi:hypothetical protein
VDEKQRDTIVRYVVTTAHPYLVDVVEEHVRGFGRADDMYGRLPVLFYAMASTWSSEGRSPPLSELGAYRLG